MEKHFDIDVHHAGTDWARNRDWIEAEARLDRIYVIRTSQESTSLGAAEAVEAYNSPAQVERAFRTLKTSRLEIRPVRAYSKDHVRAHVFLCRLAYHVDWHMPRRLARSCSRTTTARKPGRSGARPWRRPKSRKARRPGPP